MNEVIVCHYPNPIVGAAVFVLQIPWLVSFIFTSFGQVFGSDNLVLYAGFLFVMGYFLGVIQNTAHPPVADPMCPGGYIPGSPSIVAFYVSSIVFWAIFSFIFTWKRPRKFAGFMLCLLFFVPLIAVIWLRYNSPLDVGIMVLVGYGATVIFSCFIFGCYTPTKECNLNNSISVYLQYGDMLYLNKQQQKDYQQDFLVNQLLIERNNKRARKKQKVHASLPEWEN